MNLYAWAVTGGSGANGLINRLSANSDPHTISPNNNTACLNRQVMRMNKMITKDEML